MLLVVDRTRHGAGPTADAAASSRPADGAPAARPGRRPAAAPGRRCRSTGWPTWRPRPPRAAGADWPRLPFNHPLFVMFSSGTTGPPKAMVHGAGGIAARAREGTPAARRPRPGRRPLLPHDHRLDDVELAAVGAGRRRARGPLRRAGRWARRRCGGWSPTRASPSSARAPPICSCARTPATGPADGGRPEPRCAPCCPPARCCTTGSSTGWPGASAPCRCSRSPGAPTSSAASCSATPSCRCGAGRCQTRSLGLDVAAVGRGRPAESSAGSASSSAGGRSRPGRSASCGTPTAPASTTPISPAPRRVDPRRPDRDRPRRVGAAARPLRRRAERQRRADRPGRDLTASARRARGRRRDGRRAARPGAAGADPDGAAGGPRPGPASTAPWTGGSGASCAARPPRRTSPRSSWPSPSCRSRTTASPPSGPPGTRSTATRCGNLGVAQPRGAWP